MATRLSWWRAPASPSTPHRWQPPAGLAIPRWWRVPAGLAILLVAGCTGPAADSGTGSGTVPGPGWRAVTLPTSGPGRPEVRDLASCPGRWYAAGGYLMPDGSTRPALWTSPDARTWAAVPTRPSSVYGPGQLLSAVACRGDAAVAVGATSGGVHGNQRISTWTTTGGPPSPASNPPGPNPASSNPASSDPAGPGELDEVPAPFELYGGPDAIGTGRVTAGPTGWLLTGTRRDANGQAGAAVWFATDGRTFRLVDADPALESDARGQTTALDAAPGPTDAPTAPGPTGTAGLGGGGFTVVGSVRTPGSRTAERDPAAWTSSDGLTWRRLAVPAAAEDEALERAVPYRDGVLAVGERGTGFGAWLGTAGGWRATGRFGASEGAGLPVVTGLALGASQRAYALVGDGTRYRLWASSDASHWSELGLPATVPAGGQRLVSLAGTGGRLLLAAEAGTTSRLWTATG